jgi:hypothetical protein
MSLLEIFNIVNIASVLGPLLSVGNIIPQIKKTLNTRDVNGISITGIYLSLGLYFTWGVYAFVLGLIPLLITDCICFLLTMYRLYLYNLYCIEEEKDLIIR